MKQMQIFRQDCSSRRWPYCLIVACLLAVSAPASCLADQDRARAEKLLALASEKMLVKQEGAQPFHLEAQVAYSGPDGKVEGVVREIWVSKKLNRTEVFLPGYTESFGAQEGKQWFYASMAGRAAWIASVFRAFQRVESPWLAETEDVTGIKETRSAGVLLTCIESRGQHRHKVRRCFDGDSGLLTQVEEDVDELKAVIQYAAWEDRGGRVFPRDIRVYDKDQPVTQIQVTLVETDFTAEPQWFDPPTGAEYVDDCKTVEPPRIVGYVPPKSRYSRRDGVVRFGAYLTAEGKLQRLTLLKGLTAQANVAAAEAIRQWDFKPAMCDGKPTSIMIRLEVNFERPGLVLIYPRR